MKQTLLMESVKGERRLAVIEDGRLCEFYTERPNSDDAVGSIYLGRIENTVPGMNAAFVNIGLENNGFLSAGDVQTAVDAEGPIPGKPEEARIERLVRPGQQVLVQVVKAQSGQKGHRVSCRVSLPGRAMVLLPDARGANVSRKIEDDAERERLRGIARSLTEGSGMGLIVRTAAEGMDADTFGREFESLVALWRDIRARADHAVAPRRLFSNGNLVLRCVRDMLCEDTEAVWADDRETYEALVSRVKALAPQWVGRIRLHEGRMPLFDVYRVDRQLDQALRKYVWLDSGGSLVIEETEAMTVIDVNTGKFTGRKDLGDTIFRLNSEAAREIVRQLRLRDIGGIVVVDFIDMADPAQNEALLDLLRTLAKTDRGRLGVVGMTGLGLVELTRKKQHRPLTRQLMHTCSDCGGDGRVPSHETTARRAVREICRRRRMGEENPLLVEAAAPVIGWMKTLGAPDGARVYLLADPGMKAGEYRLSPADESQLNEKSILLK